MDLAISLSELGRTATSDCADDADGVGGHTHVCDTGSVVGSCVIGRG
jgi:hypothetical protein